MTFNINYIRIVFALLLFTSCSPKPSLSLFEEMNEETNTNSSLITLYGSLLDTNGNPIPNAVIELKGSSISTRSDSEGSFSLTNIPSGYFSLSIQANDYIKKEESLFLGSDYSSEIPILIELQRGMGIEIRNNYRGNDELSELLDYKDRLTSEIDSLLEVRNGIGTNIITNIDSVKAIRVQDPFFKPFRDLFVTDNPTSCAPINWTPNSFKEIRDGLPEMEIARPFNFTVINYDTGYLISVYLTGYRSIDDGLGLIFAHQSDITFRELVATNTELKAFWEENRRQLYLGSLKHFLTSLAIDKHMVDGFRVYGGQFSQQNSSSLGSSVVFSNDIELVRNEYFQEGPQEGSFILRYSGDLKIEYNRRSMRQNYQYKGLNGFRNETSWIKLNRPAVLFSSNGMLENERSLTENGLWGFRKVCEMLPIDYQL